MEYSKMEKFQMSPYFTASTLSHNGTEEGTQKSSKPTKVLRRSSSLLETRLMKRDGCSKKSDDSNVALNLCPDGSKINISSNGTNLTATKTSLNATIGSFTISINATTLMTGDAPRPPIEPSLVAVYTTHGYPLHISLEGSPCVKATDSLTAIFTNQKVYLVTLYSNGQEAHYLSANSYNYYVAIDSANNIQALPAAQINDDNEEIYTLRRENLPNDQARYYFEIGGNRHYLKATSDGQLTTQQTACDQCIFTHRYG